MTLLELKVIIDSTLERNPEAGKCIVGVPNGKNSVGYTATTEVVSAMQGFDWDVKQFFIFTQSMMMERKEK